MSDIEQLGKVKWGFEKSGYQSGLELIDQSYPIQHPEFLTIHTLCREIAIAKSGGAQQFNFIKQGLVLVEAGVLKPEELQYIYDQFEIDPDAFT